MKLRLLSSALLLALTTSAFAEHGHVMKDAMPAPLPAPAKFYVGIFGGWGSSDKFNSNQYGTAFYTEAAGGPLAVNAFGQLGSQTNSYYGAQLGYQAQGIMLNASPQWTLGPAVELEALSMSNSTFHGSLTNNTARLPEHDFHVSYPMSRNVFLGNAVLNFDNPCILFHPYVGFGIGSAIVRISGATATQVSPPELGVNHYNSNGSDTDSAFAGQFKLGVSYDINKYVSLFAEYRWLYIASTSFTFGSTVYPGHVPTSPWQVNLDAQRYNMGDVGVRFNLES